jgi:serine/threonine protein kinase
MAPEYVLRREAGERSDVFSAGVILFEMLTGQRAFVGNDINGHHAARRR